MTAALRTQIATMVRGQSVDDFIKRMTLQTTIIRAMLAHYETELEATEDIAPVFAELVDPTRSPR